MNYLSSHSLMLFFSSEMQIITYEVTLMNYEVTLVNHDVIFWRLCYKFFFIVEVIIWKCHFVSQFQVTLMIKIVPHYPISWSDQKLYESYLLIGDIPLMLGWIPFQIKPEILHELTHFLSWKHRMFSFKGNTSHLVSTHVYSWRGYKRMPSLPL